MEFAENSTYTIHLKKSAGLGDGVAGFGIRFESSCMGPRVILAIPNGEACRSGLVANGDVLVALDGVAVEGMNFKDVSRFLSSHVFSKQIQFFSSRVQYDVFFLRTIVNSFCFLR